MYRTDGQGQGGNRLDRLCGRVTALDEVPLDRGVALPAVGGVPPTARTRRAGGEERARVRPARGAAGGITRARATCAAQTHGDALDIAQLGRDTAVPDGTRRGEMPLMFLYHTVHRHEKSIASQWRPPRIVVVRRQLCSEEVSNGSPQELHIR